MEQIIHALTAYCTDHGVTDILPTVSRPDEQFGEYSTNIALQLSARLHMNPRDIAADIVRTLTADTSASIQTVSVAGPGFINITLTNAALLTAAQQTTAAQSLSGQTVLVEYSDPNAMKPLHAGHLYTTLVGDTIARLLERAGAHVVRLNYGGDVGLHVAKSMWAIIRELGGENPAALDAIAETERATWLGARYAEGNNAYEDDPAAKQAITDYNARVYALHTDNDHESAFARIYWTCRDWSYAYFKHLYEQLQVVPFDRYIPESEVTERGITTVKTQLAAGIYQESNGAVVFDGEAHGLHTRVFINSEGLPTYEAKDVGLLLTKWDDYHFDSSIVITANEQTQYYQVMLKSVAQFAPEPAERSAHITHGVVKLQGGVKMSSRKGKVVTALEIIDAAQAAATASGMNSTHETVLAAIKYAFAKNKIGGDIAYDPAESIALEGNSGPYLQYAHARACSILSKSGDYEFTTPTTLDKAERSLVRKITEYTDTVNKAIDERLPHHICTYLYELCQAFNRFYEHNRVIGDERQATRLWIVQRYAQVLRDGLELLGIHAPEKM